MNGLILDVIEIAADEEFETARADAVERLSDAENDLLAAQLYGNKRADIKAIRAAQAAVGDAFETLDAIDQEWLNEHAFDLIAF